jgi:hypothetical protein
MILIKTLYNQLVLTSKYRAIADLHILQFTVTHALDSQSAPVVHYTGNGIKTVCN